jgi:hypothetical protein
MQVHVHARQEHRLWEADAFVIDPRTTPIYQRKRRGAIAERSRRSI